MAGGNKSITSFCLRTRTVQAYIYIYAFKSLAKHDALLGGSSGRVGMIQHFVLGSKTAYTERYWFMCSSTGVWLAGVE